MAWRVERLNVVLKEELGRIVLREMEFPPGVLVTLTRVETLPRLKEAKVFVSVFPEGRLDEVWQQLNSRIYFLQQKVNRRLLMRPVPRLVFVPEKEVARAGLVEELLERVKEKPGRSSVVEKRKKR